MIEKIIMVGVIGNFLLQIHWMMWSKSIHNRKHKEDT